MRPPDACVDGEEVHALGGLLADLREHVVDGQLLDGAADDHGVDRHGAERHGRAGHIDKALADDLFALDFTTMEIQHSDPGHRIDVRAYA